MNKIKPLLGGCCLLVCLAFSAASTAESAEPNRSLDEIAVELVNPVGDLAVAPSLRARVLGDSWCHAEVYAAARSKPAFRQV